MKSKVLLNVRNASSCDGVLRLRAQSGAPLRMTDTEKTNHQSPITNHQSPITSSLRSASRHAYSTLTDLGSPERRDASAASKRVLICSFFVSRYSTVRACVVVG